MRTLVAVIGGLCVLATGCVAGQQAPLVPARQVSVVEGSSASTPTPATLAPSPVPVTPEATQTGTKVSRYALFLTAQPAQPAQSAGDVPAAEATPTPALAPATATPTAVPPAATPTPMPRLSPSPAPRRGGSDDSGQGSGHSGSGREPAIPTPTPRPFTPAPTPTLVPPTPTPAQGGTDGGDGTPLLSLTASRTSLAVGETVPVEVVLSEAPTGLSGFDLTVESASGVEVVQAELPEFGLVSISPVPSRTIRLRAADLNEVVSAGMHQTVLARLYLRGQVSGSAALSIRLTTLDDERGYPVSVRLVSTTVSVR